MKLFSIGVSRRRAAWLVLLLAAVIVGVVMSMKAPTIVQQSGDPGLPSSYPTARVAALERTLPTSGVQPALVVYSTRDSGALSPAQIAEIQRNAPVVFSALGPNGRYAGTDVSPDRTVAVSTVLVNTAGSDTTANAVVDKLRRLDLTVASGVVVHVTGGPAFTSDLTKVFSGANTTLLLTTALVVAALLLITYRSPILWIVPLLVVGTADLLTTQVVALLTQHVGIRVDQAASGITSVIVFGAGTDYALLLISRYRDQLRNTSDRFAAMRTAVGRTASAIISSAITVTASLLVLILCATESTRAIGFSAAVGIVIAMTFGLVVLPAGLVLSGRGIFWPFVPRADGGPTREGRIWGRIGRSASRHPGMVISLSLVTLVLLGLGSVGSSIGLAQPEQFTAMPESVLSQDIRATASPAGAAVPVRPLP